MDQRHRHVLIALAIVGASLGASSLARAERPLEAEKPSESTTTAVIGAVTTPVEPTPRTPLRRLTDADALGGRAREVESAMKDAAADLGLAVDLTGQIPGDGARESSMFARAAGGSWVFSVRLEGAPNGELTLRIAAVAPKSSTLVVRVEQVDATHLAARAASIVRDLVAQKPASALPPAPPSSATAAAPEEPVRSRGRPVLAVDAAALGIFGAYSIYSSAGTSDTRVLYPLLALGAGAGVGSALLASDEWDVSNGVAWTVAAGSFWGVISGLEIAEGQNVQPNGDRLAWGFAGGLVGTTLAVTTVALRRFDDGDAALTHSGAAFGTLGGAMIDLWVRGSLKQTPSWGVGLGAGVGLLGGGAFAAFSEVNPGRVMLIDLGAGLGALVGAAAGSPLVFKDETEQKDRGFVAAVLGGTLVGGTVAWLLTRGPTAPASPRRAQQSLDLGLRPFAGVIGESRRARETSPIYGMGVSGAF